MAIQVNPFAPEFIEDPYPTFRILHKEAPVFWNDALNFWMLTKYDDVVAAAKGHPDFSSIEGPASGFMQAQEGQEGQEAQKTGRSIIISDPPLHTRLRRLVGQAFTAKSISEMESRMEKITQELLDDLLESVRPGDTFDLVERFSSPLPVRVIAEVLGVPPTMHKTFKRWSDAVISTIGRDAGELQGDIDEFNRYVFGLVLDRRENPQDDLITRLVEAADPEDGQLTDEEIMGTITTLLVAGNETTTNLINSGVMTLIEHPEAYREVRQDRTLVPTMMEEVLRFRGPVQGAFRTTTRDVELRGQTIKKGQHVWLLFGAANHDEEHFPNADRFDIRRSPNDHVAFGFGIHFCLGAILARMEGRVGFEALLERVPELAMGQEPPVRSPIPVVRSIFKLPLIMGSA